MFILRGATGDCLFPATTGEYKTPHFLSIQITDRIQKATGLRINVHQFRHAAAAIYLKHHAGDYETVRRFLGHKSLKTTINFYCGLETIQASREFSKIIRQHRRIDERQHRRFDEDEPPRAGR
jgi:site-specific recombinase XerD